MLDRADDDQYRDEDDGGGGFVRAPWGRDPVADGAKSIQESEALLARAGADDRCRTVLTAATVVAALLFAAAVLFVAPQVTSHARGAPAVHRCVDNSACNALGLAGDCCPTPEGKLLGCCLDADNLVTRHPTSTAACASNSACATAGLAGDCCPTAEGAQLGCCGDAKNEVTTFIASATCALNTACALTGLDGNCCPTDEGAMLGCCPVEVVRPKGGGH